MDRIGMYMEWDKEAFFRLENGDILGVVYDTFPESPRAWDNLGTLDISGSWGSVTEEDFDFEGAMERYNVPEGADFRNSVENLMLKAREHKAVILPVSVYDHSAQHFYIGFPSERWDNYVTGFIWADEEAIKKNFMVDEVTEKELEHTEEILKGEIETFNEYANSEVYGFRVYAEDGEEKDSCYGFYGDNALEDIQEHTGKIQDYIGTYSDIYDCLEEEGLGHYEWVVTPKEEVKEVA